jgi:WD40 repeat protein/DNA-binding SARP family transcriptional activator
MGGPQLQATALGLRICALGSMRVTRDGIERPLGGARQRRLLAVLLIHRDAVVSVDRLADVVFAGEPTDAAATTLRSYVARLRRVLGDVVVTRAPGYQLSLAGVAFDVADFEAGLEAGRAALQRQDPVAAVEPLRAALALWEGDAYAEFADEPWAYPESQRLAERRLAGEELLVEAELECGRAAQILPTIEALCREHPLREAFRAQLMTAYYRAGRQADALAAFRDFREELAEELGVDPSPTLVVLEQRILAQDADLLDAVTAGEPLRGYRLGERLGSGRIGTVHAAHVPGVDREFAVKTVRADLADDPAFIRGFEATVHRIASMRHQAIVPIHDWWREPGAAYVVMRRLPGGTLRDRLQRSPLASREVVTLVERIGGALAGASALGIVHGRVTVDNVLYDGSGLPVLTDFWLGGPPGSPAPGDDVQAFAALVGEVLGADASSEVARALALSDGSTVEELTEHLLVALGAHEPAVHRRRNPYQGLRAFDEADAENYFGRASLIDDVLARLSGNGLRSRLVLLVGASGTGKSSAVRAGLLPRLRTGGAAGSEAWFVATMLPGGAPYKELAEGLRGVAVGDTHGLVEELMMGVAGIDRTLRSVVPEDGELLLVVDQFEELFTLSPEGEQREFLEALTHALTAPDSRLRVVATLRADYYDRPLGVQPFGSLVQDATVTIPAMLPAEVESAVVEPARRAGRTVERALAAELVGSLATEPAALPALQFVLFELAESSSDGELTLASYRALGGIEGAIAARAEDLYRSLDDAERHQVRALFERLVVVDAEGEPTRRRASADELDTAAEVVDRWAAARLLTLDVHPQTRMPTVEVAHEALVREWPRLRQWIEDDRSELIVIGRLRESAATWADLGRDPAALLRGARLDAALEVAARRGSLAPLEEEFVEASSEARDAELAEQADLIRRQARTNRRLRLQFAGIAVALVVALVVGLVAVDQRQQAVRERHIAVARELAAAADANVRDDPERSILLALAAVDATRRHDEPVLPEALEALHRGVASARILRSFPGVGGAMDWSPDGSLFVTEGVEDTGIVDIRDAMTGRSVQRFRGDAEDLNQVVFSPDSKRVITAGDEGSGTIRVWDIATGRQLGGITAPAGDGAWGLSVSPDGRLVAGSWPDDGKVRVFHATGGRPWVLRVEDPWDTEFSPDGRRLAVAAGGTESVYVLDVRTRRQVHEIPVPMLGDGPITWSPDGRWIATGGTEGARVYDARTGRLRLVTQGHAGDAGGLAWSPDGGLLATGSSDGTARVFALEGQTSREVARLAAQDLRNGVSSVDFSPDGTELMTSDSKITSVKVWDVRSEAASEIANIPGASESDWAANKASPITQDGRSVWIPESDGRVARYDLATGRRLQRLPDVDGTESKRLALSPDGRLLAVVGDGLPLPVWDTRTGRLAFEVGNGEEGFVSGVDWDRAGEHLAIAVGTERNGLRFRVDVVSRTGEEVGSVPEQPEVVIESVSFSSDGAVVATSVRVLPVNNPSRWGIRLWDWRSGRMLRHIQGSAFGVEFDPSGRRLASWRFLEGVADVWDTRTGERLSTLEGHSGLLQDVDFDPMGERVATAGTDGSVRVWDPRTGRQQVALRLATPVGAESVAFSPDGRRVVTTWEDGVTRVWTLDLDELIDIARARLTRGLTTAECRQYLHVDSCPSS